MPSTPRPVLLLLAGEPSGDLHAAHLARALRRRFPGCRILGTGGPRMAAEGVELLAELDDLAVMGFAEVLSRLPYFWRLERTLRKVLREEGVDLVIPVDYPGLNLRVTAHARRAGIPVVYYIAPQVWAWKEGRTERLARDADRIAVILPFEEALFRARGGAAVFVGHPLLEHTPVVPDRGSFCRAHGLDPDLPILALFPGSRRQELRRHLLPFIEAGERLRRAVPGLQIALAKAEGVDLTLPRGTEAVVVGDGQALLHHARAALVKSGTTTLEAALAGVPFVVAYRTHPLTYFLARRLVRLNRIALANLVAGEEVVPERLQGAATPEILAAALRPLLEETEARRRMIDGLAKVRERLGSPGAADRVAELAAEVLDERALPSDRREVG